MLELYLINNIKSISYILRKNLKRFFIPILLFITILYYRYKTKKTIYKRKMEYILRKDIWKSVFKLKNISEVILAI